MSTNTGLTILLNPCILHLPPVIVPFLSVILNIKIIKKSMGNFEKLSPEYTKYI